MAASSAYLDFKSAKMRACTASKKADLCSCRIGMKDRGKGSSGRMQREIVQNMQARL